MREQAEKRWIFSLGSVAQLQHIYLQEQEVLLVHAEDLKDYYHCFRVSEQRTSRNALKMKVKPEEVRHLSCYEESMEAEKFLVPSLATLAMGDINAVAFGQTAHLAVVLRSGALRLRDFIGLRARPSRRAIVAGLMIDDFVLFEKVRVDELRQGGEGWRSPGAEVISKVREAYCEAGLPRHEGKAVEQQTEAECWGIEIDGISGIARPNLKRVIPMANIIVQVVQLGYISVALLEVISGALCSIFSVRRRLMSILHEVYCAQRGRERHEIVRMSKPLKDELMMSVALMTVAVIDMRLDPGEDLIATDASSVAEAAVATKIGKERTAEFQRYGLQKGLWNRLMSPAAAYEKEKGTLAEEDELPDATYDMNPVWRRVLASQQFRPFGSTKLSRNREHINIKEVSAALRAEKQIGSARPSSFYVHLQDSQVSLAAMVKGRSSSWALNKRLRRSIADHIGFNIKGSMAM